jgi:hypothetical protein
MPASPTAEREQDTSVDAFGLTLDNLVHALKEDPSADSDGEESEDGGDFTARNLQDAPQSLRVPEMFAQLLKHGDCGPASPQTPRLR